MLGDDVGKSANEDRRFVQRLRAVDLHTKLPNEVLSVKGLLIRIKTDLFAFLDILEV